MKRISKAAIVEGEIRTEPATASELARLAKFRRTGGSPGNPSWYKARKIAPFVFEAGLPAAVPAWTRSTTIAPQKMKFPSSLIEDPAEYVREFEISNSLVPAPIKWVKPSLGCFG